MMVVVLKTNQVAEPNQSAGYSANNWEMLDFYVAFLSLVQWCKKSWVVRHLCCVVVVILTRYLVSLEVSRCRGMLFPDSIYSGAIFKRRIESYFKK